MLVDRPTRNVAGDLPRKWLFDDTLELIVWYSSLSQIHGFRLLYDLRNTPKAFSWMNDQGYSHRLIDCGDDNPSKDQMAILAGNTDCDFSMLLSLFEKHSTLLPSGIRNLVTHHLKFCATKRQA